jgi:hypothetical protein
MSKNFSRALDFELRARAPKNGDPCQSFSLDMFRLAFASSPSPCSQLSTPIPSWKRLQKRTGDGGGGTPFSSSDFAAVQRET